MVPVIPFVSRRILSLLAWGFEERRGEVPVPVDGASGLLMARYTTSAENSCAWQAAGIRPRRNVAARFVALSFMLCSFVAGLHQIGRPSPSELSGHAANLYGVVTLSQ